MNTGVTPEQLSAAERRSVDLHGLGPGFQCPECAMTAEDWASCFVRPEEAIVLRADVASVLGYFQGDQEEDYGLPPEVLARLAAVLGDDG